MSSDVANLPSAAPTESKTAKKKKAKAEAAGQAAGLPIRNTSADRTDSPAPSARGNGAGGEEGESPYVTDLRKQVRNVKKKLNNMQKVDDIIAENSGLTLDELVTARKINADQKAQALKKPSLQEKLADLEMQLEQYKKFDEENQRKIASQRELLQSTHKDELEKLRDAVKAEAEAEAKLDFRQRLLTLSRFLRAAAARRQHEDDGTDEAKAFEGALLLVYGGDISAVDACERLIDGTEDTVPSTDGTLLNVTYTRVKQLALEETPEPLDESSSAEDVQAETAAPGDVVEAAHEPGTDPTVANAGLTEIDTAIPATESSDRALETGAPPEARVDDEAANTAAEGWDTKAPGEEPLSESFEMIPRDPAETEKASEPAPNNSTQSWADDAPVEAAPVEAAPVEAAPAEAAPAEKPADANGNDGFREVHHPRGRGRGGFQGERGGFRGRGRGEGRGRGGYRGDGRGRGRGFRGRGRGDSQQQHQHQQHQQHQQQHQPHQQQS